MGGCRRRGLFSKETIEKLASCKFADYFEWDVMLERQTVRNLPITMTVYCLTVITGCIAAYLYYLIECDELFECIYTAVMETVISKWVC